MSVRSRCCISPACAMRPASTASSCDTDAADLLRAVCGAVQRHGIGLPAAKQLRVAVDGAFARWDERAARRQRGRVHPAGVGRLRCRVRDQRRAVRDRAAARAGLLRPRRRRLRQLRRLGARPQRRAGPCTACATKPTRALAEAEGAGDPGRGAAALRPSSDAACVHRTGDLAHRRAGRLGRRQRRPSRPRLRRLPLDHRRGEIARPDLEARALRRRRRRLAAPRPRDRLPPMPHHGCAEQADRLRIKRRGCRSDAPVPEVPAAGGQVRARSTGREAPLGKGGAPTGAGDRKCRLGPGFAKQTLGAVRAAPKMAVAPPASPAPTSVNTVAAFRPWRSFRPSVAGGRRGHH